MRHLDHIWCKFSSEIQWDHSQHPKIYRSRDIGHFRSNSKKIWPGVPLYLFIILVYYLFATRLAQPSYTPQLCFRWCRMRIWTLFFHQTSIFKNIYDDWPGQKLGASEGQGAELQLYSTPPLHLLNRYKCRPTVSSYRKSILLLVRRQP